MKVLTFSLTGHDGEANVDVAVDGIGVGADFVRRRDQLFGFLLVDSGDGDRKCGREYEAARLVATEADLGDDFNVFVHKLQPGITADVQDRVLETGGVTAGKQRLRVGRIPLAA